MEFYFAIKRRNKHEQMDKASCVGTVGVYAGRRAIPMTAMLPYAAPTSGYGSNGKFPAPIDPPAAGSIAISNKAQLEAIANNLSGKYHLTNDINLSGSEWVPIGDTYFGTPFKGVFDGQGYVISNLKITGEGYKNNGLFGCIVSASVKNVGFESTNISITPSDGATAGAVCGESYGAIDNCYNAGNISVDTAAYNVAVIAGGLCGTMGNSTLGTPSLQYCFNTGNITAKSTNTTSYNSPASAGGISGSVGTSISLSRSYNTGTVSSHAYTYATSGGICAGSGTTVFTDGPVYICYNTGNVSAVSTRPAFGGKAQAGGINGSGPQQNCFNTGAVSATGYDAYAGGTTIAAGGVGTGSSSNSYNTGTVTASAGNDKNIGGILASVYGYGGAYNSYCLDLYGSPFGTQLTSAQMKNKASFVGFNFDTIWDISPSVNNGYPHLRAFVPATYTLTLNANNGSVSPTSVTQAQGTTYTLPTPTRNGYTFTGWTLSGGGSLSGNVYTFGTSNGTVTAGWTANTTNYTVTVNNGTGSGNYAANATVNITANAPPTGKVFDKWTTTDGVTFVNSNATSTSFTMPTKNVTVTATYRDGGHTNPAKGIFGTNPKWYGAWWHYILFFIGFGFIWMWF